MRKTFGGEHKTLFEELNKQAFRILLSIFIVFNSTLPAASQKATRQKPIVIEKQGSFAVGGSVINNSGSFIPYNPTAEGQSFRGDHAYVFYQIPVKARKYPLVMWHGYGDRRWQVDN